jgi:hypothetical protein
MLFGETVADYCENHAEQINAVRTSQETHYVSIAQPNQLMLFVSKTMRNTTNTICAGIFNVYASGIIIAIRAVTNLGSRGPATCEVPPRVLTAT